MGSDLSCKVDSPSHCRPLAFAQKRKQAIVFCWQGLLVLLGATVLVVNIIESSKQQQQNGCNHTYIHPIEPFFHHRNTKSLREIFNALDVHLYMILLFTSSNSTDFSRPITYMFREYSTQSQIG